MSPDRALITPPGLISRNIQLTVMFSMSVGDRTLGQADVEGSNFCGTKSRLDCLDEEATPAHYIPAYTDALHPPPSKSLES